jgi:undecaprenyl diphosphate synthase
MVDGQKKNIYRDQLAIGQVWKLQKKRFGDAQNRGSKLSLSLHSVAKIGNAPRERSPIHELHKNHIQFRVIGDDTQLSDRLKKAIFEAQTLTQNNTGLILVVALNYGGRWDLVQATRRISAALTADKIKPENIDEALLAAHLSTANLPDPDLFIRTGGESRISNFLLWQMAYTELYFTDIFWPEFDEAALEQALVFFATRQRRFGGL